jgi:hypothetical protein
VVANAAAAARDAVVAATVVFANASAAALNAAIKSGVVRAQDVAGSVAPQLNRSTGIRSVRPVRVRARQIHGLRAVENGHHDGGSTSARYVTHAAADGLLGALAFETCVPAALMLTDATATARDTVVLGPMVMARAGAAAVAAGGALAVDAEEMAVGATGDFAVQCSKRMLHASGRRSSRFALVVRTQHARSRGKGGRRRGGGIAV